MGKILYFDCIDSTNAYCKRESASLESGTAVAAARQTAGRGRLGRSFSSGDGGLYISYIIKPRTAPGELLEITGMAAVAVSRAIEKICGIRPDIKWTNDLLINGRKICGILTEAGFEGDRLAYIVIGIGINANTQAFPENLGSTATSVMLETGTKTDIRALAEEVSAELDRLDNADVAAYADEYRTHCVTLGKTVTAVFGGYTVTGEATAIDDRFGLVIKKNAGDVTVRSGEATLAKRQTEI